MELRRRLLQRRWPGRGGSDEHARSFLREPLREGQRTTEEDSMNEDGVDIDPEDPDNIPVFVQGDKRKFHSTNPWDVIEHDRALAEFEKRQQARIEAQNTETEIW